MEYKNAYGNERNRRSPNYVGTVRIINGQVAPEDAELIERIKNNCKATNRIMAESRSKRRAKWSIRGRKPLEGYGWVSSCRYGGPTKVELKHATEADVYTFTRYI
jgi:hypothetical protein